MPMHALYKGFFPFLSNCIDRVKSYCYLIAIVLTQFKKTPLSSLFWIFFPNPSKDSPVSLKSLLVGWALPTTACGALRLRGH